MSEIQIANYAFIDFYNNNKSDNETLDLNKSEDRSKIVLEIFRHSKINSDNENKSLFDNLVREFYQTKQSVNIIFSQELSKLFNFIIKRMGMKISETEPRNKNLLDFLNILVDIYEDIIKAAEHETHAQFGDANTIWKKIFGDKFPNFDKNLKERYLINTLNQHDK